LAFKNRILGSQNKQEARMAPHYKTATVFGGTGFIGRQIVRELARRGIVVKVPCRVPERAYELKTAGAVGQIVPVLCNIRDDESLRAAIRGSDYVINCIGILFERGKRQTFKSMHAELPGRIAALCAAEKTQRLVHISALGADRGTSRYARSKLAGEEALLAAFPSATILRPSVVFGEDDNFFNMFAKMAQILPFLPLIGGGHTKFQPVYVGDVADGVMAALAFPAVAPGNPQGRVYELGGPEVLSFREIYARLFSFTQNPRPLVTLPFFLAKIQAAFLSLMPMPLLTPDQVESLKSDNVVTSGALTLANLGVTAKALDMILPLYLTRYRAGGRFGPIKTAA
jgi:NADH dehydrogenase